MYFLLTELFERNPYLGFYKPVSFLKLILNNIHLGSNVSTCARWAGFPKGIPLNDCFWTLKEKKCCAWSNIWGRTGKPNQSSGKYRQILGCGLRLYYPKWQHTECVFIFPEKSNRKGKYYQRNHLTWIHSKIKTNWVKIQISHFGIYPLPVLGPAKGINVKGSISHGCLQGNLRPQK